MYFIKKPHHFNEVTVIYIKVITDLLIPLINIKADIPISHYLSKSQFFYPKSTINIREIFHNDLLNERQIA